MRREIAVRLQKSLLLAGLLLAVSCQPAFSDSFDDATDALRKEFQESLKASPRGKEDPIISAARVPIIFKKDGHILVTDTDSEPYERALENHKFREDVFYSDRLCNQAIGLSDKELSEWLGQPEAMSLRFSNTSNFVYIRSYLFGGGQIPILISVENGLCTGAWCDYKWNKQKLRDFNDSGESVFFKGKTDAELFAQFGHALTYNQKPVQSLGDLPQGETEEYKLSLYDNVLMMKGHRCEELLKTGHFSIGYVFEVYKRPPR